MPDVPTLCRLCLLMQGKSSGGRRMDNAAQLCRMKREKSGSESPGIVQVGAESEKEEENEEEGGEEDGRGGERKGVFD